MYITINQNKFESKLTNSINYPSHVAAKLNPTVLAQLSDYLLNTMAYTLSSSDTITLDDTTINYSFTISPQEQAQVLDILNSTI